MNNKTEENWKIVRNRVCIRALLIFLGTVMMQLLAYMVCMIVMTANVLFFDKKNMELLQEIAEANTKSGSFLIWVSLVSALLSLIWCAILYKKSSWREKDFDYKKAFSLKNTSAVIGAGFGGCVILTMVITVISYAIPSAFTQYNQIMDHLSANSVGITMLYVLLIGPASEEMIFRGAILDRFHLAFPFMIANVLQAVLFGIYHMNLIQGLYAFCLGMVLGMIRYVTGTILASIIAHIIFNATSYGISYINEIGGTMGNAVLIGITLVGIVAFVLGIWYLWKRYQDMTKNVEKV